MYEPEVDDYVIWNRPNGDIEEGWVYFKGDPVDNEKRIKQGWNTISRYITIETILIVTYSLPAVKYKSSNSCLIFL